MGSMGMRGEVMMGKQRAKQRSWSLSHQMWDAGQFLSLKELGKPYIFT